MTPQKLLCFIVEIQCTYKPENIQSLGIRILKKGIIGTTAVKQPDQINIVR